ncbi:MAG: transporter substrate-binding domain-containing protein, partial [Firmicutes bacterium]|nr:transporter substrate-binding domain-containing protein [Bacillota bacterium]
MNRKQPSKKIPRRVLAALLFLALLLSFAACDNGQLGYRVVGSAGAQDLVMAFRADDTVGVLVPAAIRELKAEGKVAELATRWFGSDITKFKAERGAVSAALQSLGLDAPPSRDFILGIDGGAVPFSFARSGAYTGFDVELARAVCGKLGWTLSIQPISPFDVEVELASGDIDGAWGGLSVPGGSTDQMT